MENPNKHSRFNYIQYDERATEIATEMKGRCDGLAGKIEELLQDERYKALALDHLEIAFAMIGKAIRNDQIFRQGVPAPETDGNPEAPTEGAATEVPVQ